MAATHNVAVAVTVNLAAAPPTVASYRHLILLDEATGNTLGGDRVTSFATPAAVDAAEDASELSTAGANQIKAALAQRPRADFVYAGRVDTGGAETYSDGLNAVIAEIGADAFFTISIDSRVAAVQSALATTVEALDAMLFVQASDSDFLTASLPAAYSWYTTEQTALIWHDTDSTYQDTAWGTKFVAVDPEDRAGPGTVPLAGVAALATGLTDGERVAALGNNANLALPLGSSPYFVLNGYNGAGRPIHEILTKTWLTRAIKADVASAWVSFGARNEKWTVTPRGAAVLRQILEGVGQRGINAGHFEPDNVEVSVPAPSAADANAGILRATMRVQIGNTVIEFAVTVDASRTPLASA